MAKQNKKKSPGKRHDLPKKNTSRNNSDTTKGLRTCVAVIILLLLASGIIWTLHVKQSEKPKNVKEFVQMLFHIEKNPPVPLQGVSEVFPDLGIREDYLTVNEYSRPQQELTEVKNIVIHYVANPGSTAQNNRDYFENLKDTGATYASSHFVIGLDGEIIQCIPLNEICYASNERNVDSISIEMCHPGEDGAFNDATYNACVYLAASLCDYYRIDTDHVIRHYDVTGKNCPKFFVEHEDRWEVFRGFVDEYKEKRKNSINLDAIHKEEKN